MYEAQFGLNKRPFRALAKGTDVFVGPQTAAAMAGLKKALASPDAIVAVGGPVGVGKTTVVLRALKALGKQQLIISVGRMQLGHDEVLELLLEEMGVELPSGTVQRFTTFRRELKKHAAEGARTFIVVEDAARIGPDALAELEALTASDAGVSEGANVVLMGDEGLDAALKAPQLARLRQRLRLRQNIAPLSNAELLGYLKHCFRLAGNEFDQVFEDGSAEVLHRLSGGIPRVANNLVESSLVSAVENKLERVNVAQIKLVASEEYDLSLSGEAQVQAEPAPAPPEPRATERLSPATPEPQASAEDGVPELIQDTLPDLEILSPELVNPPRDEEVRSAVEPQEEGQQDGVPEWERDPTLAQLRPDLDALEQAMAVAQGLTSDTEDEDAEADVAPEEPPELVPEITLDREIQAKVTEAEEHLRLEAERRAAAEAEAQKESKIDDRPTSEIIAEALAKKDDTKKAPDNSVEAQFEATLPTLEVPAEGDTINELPVLKDATEPAFQPAAHKAPEPTPEPVVAPEPTPEPVVAPKTASEPVAVPKPAPEPVAAPKPAPEPVVASKPAPTPPPKPQPALELELEPEQEAALKPAAAPVIEPTPEPEPEPDPVALEQARKADAELEQIATNLARAKTIDECDDKMAETLFGEEFSMMAAQVAAMAPPEPSANDDMEEPAKEPVEEPAPAAIPDFESAAAVNVELESTPNGNGGPIDTSASQRLATVRALNTGAPDAPPPGTPTPAPDSPAPQPPVEQPQSIEDQINTSMTQTLNTLNVRPAVAHDDDDDDDEGKGGFFSRFKRS